MLIYLDESGDLGFNFDNQNTNRYLIITALVCDAANSARQFNIAARKTIKHKLQTKKFVPQEIKGFSSNIVVKRYFLTHLSSNNSWRLYTVIADKESWLKKPNINYDKNDIYDEIIIKLLSLVDYPSESSHINIIIDRSKSYEPMEILNKRLRNALIKILGDNVLLTIKHAQSNEQGGLQAVDLFCWGIHRKYHFGDMEWYNEFSQHIVGELIYKF